MQSNGAAITLSSSGSGRIQQLIYGYVQFWSDFKTESDTFQVISPFLLRMHNAHIDQLMCPIYGDDTSASEATAHCDTLISCDLEIFLLTYLLC